MSKMRIYELAKELGVDNKVVIQLARDIGVPGKLSHSNSLDPSEVDKIRRAVIRQAIGTTPESEVVTTRVDKSTGQTSTIVESRKGGLIRRRRKDSEDAGETPAEEQHAEAAPTDAASIHEAAVEAAVEGEALEAAAEPDSAEAQAEEIQEAVDASAPGATEEESKKTVGPRVLGKIALPQKKAVVKPAAKKAFAPGSGAVVQPAVVDDEEGAARKKKGRKREISRLELVDYEGRPTRRTPRGSKEGRDKSAAAGQQVDPAQARAVTKKPVKLAAESILLGELAKQMSLKAGEVIAKLMELGIMATINQAIDADTAAVVAEEMGYEVQRTAFDEATILEQKDVDDPALLKPRSPVVTVMGHVDHGKTSLLDRIRKASVAQGEHGGITQHIGAYRVTLEDGRGITFIDTPGHAAFTTMRARGADVTDVVVLVVAGDDGVMPQTIEAVNHAKAAKVPIIVAVNKSDKPSFNPDRVKKQLAENGLSPEEWGGDTLYFNVSAVKGDGIRELLEGILLVVEMRELRANPDRRALGTVIEARQDKGRGSVATVLVQNGTLRVGDVFVSGAEYGRVRSMMDADGKKLKEAGPSMPVEITGLSGVPSAGDDFFVVESDAAARQVVDSRSDRRTASELRLAAGPISLEEFARRSSGVQAAGLNIILKTDVHGSLEAVRSAIEQLSTDKVKVRVIHAAVGGINESDIQLAVASQAVVIGFGVRAEPRATAEAEAAGIDLRFYRVIYELLDDVKNAMAGLLEPIKKEVALGRVEVRDTFSIPKVGTVAGCYVSDGLVRRGARLRLLRDSRVIFEGKMGTLRRFKDDVREVQSGYECGLSIEGFNDVKAGDIMEVYEVSEVAATL